MRKTHALVNVVQTMMDDPAGKHWGYELSRRAGVRSGVLYPILGRMLDEGWVEDGWEDPASIDSPRPPRRYYTLTADGTTAMWKVLAEARTDPRFVPVLGGAN
jgi:PadR family transcriptional regulator PadR